jgi:hypothetical protein
MSVIFRHRHHHSSLQQSPNLLFKHHQWGAKSNASTTGKTAQDYKPMTFFEWQCPHCSYTNSKDMSRSDFEDTSEAIRTCIMCYNLRVPSSNGTSLAKNLLLNIYLIFYLIHCLTCWIETFCSNVVGSLTN